ncbi:MAG TPA: Wzt carbohydrate-binding domain-containing protein, partial [Dongiaceae bacterium]|nr:Wzt carbohydrate-binding domain-containing protein [Dongiaceae bacterium]
IDFSEIREFIDAPVQSYSSGMAVRLGFAVAVHCQPDILLLDEVLAVGDMAFQAKCFNKLAEFREQGVAFILVSHNMHHISRYSNRVLYMKRGQVAYLGETETGVEHFTRDMDAVGSGVKGEQTDWGRVYGSGKVILKRAAFANEAGESINVLKSGDTFKLLIDYECPGADIDDAMLDVLIRDREGVLLQATSRSYGVNFGRLAKAGQFSVTFDGMPANGTEIQFFVVVLSQKNAEVYDWKRHIRLKVDHDPRNTGRIALGLQWTNTISS